ncbi:MAG: hypothetical protein S4CHLAM81_15420 [Chlamydiales bacterium]|nr:hypothetical protein [Chlamydiales bacterium]MCH9703691.1 hypothetical protein [Chlamydiota bacterium]
MLGDVAGIQKKNMTFGKSNMDDKEQILVNGTRMDLAFFEDNLSEARSCTWTKVTSSSVEDHQHCIVCTAPLSASTGSLYKSGHVFLCAYCHDHFLKED